MTDSTRERWLARLAKLKVDRAKSDPARHKPLLLLVVSELAEQGLLPQGILPLPPELAFRFCIYWRISRVAGNKSGTFDFRFITCKVSSSGSIVDTARIHQFSDSRNNDVRNGIALRKNAHWLFNNGLWTIADDYTVVAAHGRFAEENPEQTSLADEDGRTIRLPSDRALLPDRTHLAWHRTNRFVGKA